MKGFVNNIEKMALENDKFRQVVYTAKNTQLTLMHLEPGEDIGEEVHDVDQFLRVEAGDGKVVLDGVETEIHAGSAVIVPVGVKHNLVNTSQTQPMKLYSLYCPPHHRDGVIHKTKAEALVDEEHFDGKTTD